MLDRKKEYIAEALDEIRDEYIEEALLAGEHAADTMAENAEEPATVSSLEKKQRKKWQNIFSSLVPVAACLVLVISLGIHFGHDMFGGYGSADTGLSGVGVNPGEEEMAGAEMAQDINDGSAVQQEESNGGSTQDMSGVSLESLLEYRSAEEILSEDIVIFRGVVEEMASYTAGDGSEGQSPHTILSVRVVDCLKGNLQAGEICQILIPVVASGYETSIAGDLSRLEIGSEAIFMPYVGEDFYYYSEGIRYLFLDTGNGVSYATDVYDIPAEGPVTLDDVEAYLKEKLK